MSEGDEEGEGYGPYAAVTGVLKMVYANTRGAGRVSAERGGGREEAW